MTTISRTSIHLDNAGCMYTEASSLGWAPGEWPESIAVPARTGGSLVFDRSHLALVDGEGDLQGYRYFGRDNVQLLTVFND